MSSNPSVVNRIRFGLIDSDRMIEIQTKTISIRQDHPTITVESEPNKFAKVHTGHVINEIKFDFDCPADMMDDIISLMYKDGWLHLDEDLPPMKGQFYDIEFTSSASSNHTMNCSIYFNGSYEYIQEQAKKATMVERKKKQKKKKKTKQRRNIKRKISFH